MDLPHIGSLSQSVELIRVETNLFNLYIQGKPFHPTVEFLQLHHTEEGKWVDTSLQVSTLSTVLSIEKVSVFTPQLGELSPWQTGDPSYPIFSRRSLMS